MFPILTALISTVGLLFVIAGKITLGRSFGIVPANRGVVAGPYTLVRHPIYAGYLLSHIVRLRLPDDVEPRDPGGDRRGTGSRNCARSVSAPTGPISCAAGSPGICCRGCFDYLDRGGRGGRAVTPVTRQRPFRVCLLSSPVLSRGELDGAKTALMNSRSGSMVATTTDSSDAIRTAAGLLDRTALDPSTALVLAPCLMIHTAFMRFPIDVIFVDRAGRVVRIVQDLGPWRIAASFGAHATVELAAGAVVSHDVVVGDFLYLEGTAGAGFTAKGLLSSSLEHSRKTAASAAACA